MNISYVDIAQMATAFKKQVVCDFQLLKRLLTDVETNSSHRAHLLQMCIEKFAKYYQLSMGNQIDKHHNWAERVIPQLFENRYSTILTDNSLKKSLKEIRLFCKQIDLLAPAHYGTDKQNPTNCEYPWEITDVYGGNPRAFAPCEYHFAIFEDRQQPITRKILELIEEHIQ
jgi:hypothetical protein